MYYDDEARRFNFLSGLVFGTMLGTGLALLLAPQRGRLGRGRGDWKNRAQGGLERLREGVLEPMVEAVVAAGRKHLNDRGGHDSGR